MDWDSFYARLQAGKYIAEICFYFADDPEEAERFIGFLPGDERPYWIGLCDVENGCEFATAEELVNAPVFSGSTLKQRWGQVVICTVEGLALEDWLRMYPQ